MTRRRALVTGAALACTLGVAALTALQQQERFPHRKHERLFPVCEGCHEGVTTGVAAETFPRASVCAECHDGKRVKQVEWQRPPERVSNLQFSHTEHFAETARTDSTITCQSCHAAQGAPTRMNVRGPNPDLCVQCHAHKSDVHLAAAANCRMCHVPIVQATKLTVERVSALPRPAWHDSAGFASTHGRAVGNDELRAATCAVCHARQTCERCHANAEQVPLIRSLSADPRVALLERDRKAEYPVPRSHEAEHWQLLHGDSARTSTSCANCHTRTSCAACHANASGRAQTVIAALPEARPGSAAGVQLVGAAATIHPPDIARRHAGIAATGKANCSACHSQQTCAACHAGSDSRAFHLPNFVERHATDAFARSSDCQSCHSTERFCRDCHTRSGVGAQGAMNAAFHTGQPMWFLSHGQAARTGMEACASCHRQNDCMRCHSAVGGWRVNPHGPGFPATRVADRNAASCRWCHASIPGGGS